jgi:hypothetical protein
MNTLVRGWLTCLCAMNPWRVGSMLWSGMVDQADWAWCIKELVEVCYPKAEWLVLVMDRLSTHTPAALYAKVKLAEATLATVLEGRSYNLCYFCLLLAKSAPISYNEASIVRA